MYKKIPLKVLIVVCYLTLLPIYIMFGLKYKFVIAMIYTTMFALRAFNKVYEFKSIVPIELVLITFGGVLTYGYFNLMKADPEGTFLFNVALLIKYLLARAPYYMIFYKERDFHYLTVVESEEEVR